jgi:hypothetical protein
MEWGRQQVRPASGLCPIVSFDINYLKHNGNDMNHLI